MTTKEPKDIFISFRISVEEASVWKRAQRQMGYRFRSAMVRDSVNSRVISHTQDTSPRSLEEIVQLKRIGSTLMDIRSLIAANDNIQDVPGLEEDLEAAINHVLALKKG